MGSTFRGGVHLYAKGLQMNAAGTTMMEERKYGNNTRTTD